MSRDPPVAEPTKPSVGGNFLEPLRQNAIGDEDLLDLETRLSEITHYVRYNYLFSL
jgi:hypothetical protein